MAALTAVGAMVRVPLPYVPLTLQPAFVCLSGLWLGPLLGAASQGVYLAAGLLGAPVFARGGGPQYVLEPTFGYLLAYPAAALVAGWIGRRPSFRWTVMAVLAAYGAIYVLGIAVLYANLRYVVGQPITPAGAARLGLAPLPKDLLLGPAVAYLAHLVRRRLPIARP
ncbi:MAG: biotin transporter BioY [Candidatus Latescibacterota bacterium]